MDLNTKERLDLKNFYSTTTDAIHELRKEVALLQYRLSCHKMDIEESPMAMMTLVKDMDAQVGIDWDENRDTSDWAYGLEDK